MALSASGGDGGSAAWLVCGTGTRLCALPLARVVETLRRLPVRPFAGMPPSVDGLCMIRGAPVPVVDAARLLGETAAAPPRFLVTLAVGGRPVALAVAELLGVRHFAGAAEALPPLLREAAGEAVQAIGVLDGELLLVLGDARLLPEAALRAAEAAA